MIGIYKGKYCIATVQMLLLLQELLQLLQKVICCQHWHQRVLNKVKLGHRLKGNSQNMGPRIKTNICRQSEKELLTIKFWIVWKGCWNPFFFKEFFSTCFLIQEIWKVAILVLVGELCWVTEDVWLSHCQSHLPSLGKYLSFSRKC